ncbi:MAG TPA: GDSL-type esterase/lipase family protein [Blastocatellia bacterium]|nr:GDSL-type esterase/lipase family protein [Blastocatellia bacterium]
MITFRNRCLIISIASAWLILVDQCASARTIRQPIEDPGGKAMPDFYESLSLSRKGEAITRIVHYGDSHVAADLLTGSLRQHLQSFFGDAGTGFVFAGRPWSWYAPNGVALSASSGWRADGLNQASLAGDGRFGLAGVSFSATSAGEWISLSAACRSFDLYLLKQPGGGSIDIFLDGAEYRRNVSLASKRGEPAYIKIEAETDALHSIELRTVAKGLVRALGVVVERETAGIIYDALGINGARASRVLSWDWRLLASNIERRDPNLIIIAYGSNEVSDDDLDLAEYEQSFLTLLNQFRESAPRASLLVISPPDRAVRVGRRWQTISRMPALVKAQRRAAFEAGAAFFDLFQAMGGAGSIERWATLREPLAQSDRVHLTAAGYRLVAGWLYTELMQGWEKSNKNAFH